MMSHVLTSSAYGHFARCGKYRCETLPQPMTPTRILLRNGRSGRFGGSQRITGFDTCQHNCRSGRGGLFQKLPAVKFGSHELLQWSCQGALVRLNAWQLRKL